MELSENSHVEDAKCYHQKGKLHNDFAWFKSTFENQTVVSSIDIFNMEINDPANGASSALLKGAKVYIDEKLCNTIPTNITMGQVIHIKCKNPDPTQNRLAKDKDKFVGITGKSIRIESV